MIASAAPSDAGLALLTNPLASPLLAPAALTLGALFGSALLALAALGRGRPWRGWTRPLFLRWRTWLAIAPIYVLAVLGGAAPLLVLLGVVAAQGTREYARLVHLPPPYAALLAACGVLALLAAARSREAFLALPPLALGACTLLPILTQDARNGARHLAFLALGLLYLPVLLGSALLLAREVDGGPGLLLALGLALALSDVGAFAVGRLVGRRPLAPALSPNKTLAGLAGNLLGAALGLDLLAFALPAEGRWPLLAALALLVALGAAWGDLLESLLKREFGVKDAGTLLPGMGGLLDRVDSFLVAVPLAYVYLTFAR